MFFRKKCTVVVTLHATQGAVFVWSADLCTLQAVHEFFFPAFSCLPLAILAATIHEAIAPYGHCKTVQFLLDEPFVKRAYFAEKEPAASYGCSSVLVEEQWYVAEFLPIIFFQLACVSRLSKCSSFGVHALFGQQLLLQQRHELCPAEVPAALVGDGAAAWQLCRQLKKEKRSWW